MRTITGTASSATAIFRNRQSPGSWRGTRGRPICRCLAGAGAPVGALAPAVGGRITPVNRARQTLRARSVRSTAGRAFPESARSQQTGGSVTAVRGDGESSHFQEGQDAQHAGDRKLRRSDQLIGRRTAGDEGFRYRTLAPAEVREHGFPGSRRSLRGALGGSGADRFAGIRVGRGKPEVLEQLWDSSDDSG